MTLDTSEHHHWLTSSEPSLGSHQWTALRACQAIAARHYRASAFSSFVGLDTLTASSDLAQQRATSWRLHRFELSKSNISCIQFQVLFLNTRNDERRTGDLTALDAANVVASSLPRDRLALAGQVLCWAPLRENTPALSCTNIECSRVRDTPGKRELLIVELLVFARCAFSTRKGSVAEN